MSSSQSVRSVGASQLVASCHNFISNSLPPRLIIDRGFPDPAKSVELTPCRHRSEKKTAFLQLRSKTKFEETIIEETLFANR
jgi:hypothetical protein